MKADIHPTYFADAKIVCACGAVYNIPSTVKEMHVELCSNCHPYYTGTAKLVDTARRIDKFQAKLVKAQEAQDKLAKNKKKAPAVEKKEEEANVAS